MAEHVLKCWPEYWDAIERGDKTFEVRVNDRGYQRGDVLVLRKFDPTTQSYALDYSKGRHFGEPKELRRGISYVMQGGQFGLEARYCVLALQPAPGQ